MSKPKTIILIADLALILFLVLFHLLIVVSHRNLPGRHTLRSLVTVKIKNKKITFNEISGPSLATEAFILKWGVICNFSKTLVIYA